jgi:hypothetical protein
VPEMLIKQDTLKKIVLEMDPANRIKWIGAQNVTVIIDMAARRAIRTDEFVFGRKQQMELSFEQVSRINIHCEEVGHSCALQLESPSMTPFIVNIFFPTDADRSPLTKFSKKLGRLLRKPVVLKNTDSGDLISEKIIQPLAKQARAL